MEIVVRVAVEQRVNMTLNQSYDGAVSSYNSSIVAEGIGVTWGRGQIPPPPAHIFQPSNGLFGY
jgi:hypothetical protein